MPRPRRASNLALRVSTALVGAPLMLGLIYYGGEVGLRVLAGILSLGMIYEFSRIVFNLPDRGSKLVFGLLLTAGLHLLWFQVDRFLLLSLVFLFMFSFFLFQAARFKGSSLLVHTQEMMFLLFGFFYVAVLPLFLPMFAEFENAVHLTFLFFLIVWSADTGAYFAGRAFGRHKLYALVSPKKTIEGAIGGLILSVVVALLYWKFFLMELNLTLLVYTAIVVNVVSQIGDLCESLVKRAFDKKDSGSILPGHGGLLDRFDGVVFGLPAMYICIKFLGQTIS